MISDQQHDSYYEHIRAVRSSFNVPVANVEFLYEMVGEVHYNRTWSARILA